jgi:hypothetical protein
MGVIARVRRVGRCSGKQEFDNEYDVVFGFISTAIKNMKQTSKQINK